MNETPTRPVSVVRRFGWGSGADELGHDIPEEGAPVGPQTATVDADGRAWIVDAVNGRLVVADLNGGGSRSLPLPSAGVQDVVALPEGGAALLDRHVAQQVAVLDDAGQLVGTAPLAGPSVSTPGTVTALFARDDGLYAEVGHRDLVRVAAADGTPDVDQPAVPGRFSADGRWLLQAQRSGNDGVMVVVRSPQRPEAGTRLFAAVRFEGTVVEILLLDSLADGRVLLAARVVDGRPGAGGEEWIALVALSPEGAPVARGRFPMASSPEEQYRSIRLGADGTVYGLLPNDDGVTLWGWRP